MTDNEVIKALECCSQSGDFTKTQDEICSPCPYFNYGDCTGELKADALDLINRLQAENERLEKEAFTYKIRWAKSEVRENKAKADAYKECVEKVKKEIDSQSHSRSLEASGERFRIYKILDNLLKELVGEDNG